MPHESDATGKLHNPEQQAGIHPAVGDDAPYAEPPDTSEEHTLLRCPNCGHICRVGELACPNCHQVFGAGGKTQQFDLPEFVSQIKGLPTGDGIVTEQKPIVFEINGERLTLPVADVITVGRTPDDAVLPYPHVDLSRFDAKDQGVSRYHIRLRRKGILVYLADIGSTNGTHLNGRRLPNDPNRLEERLLRDGDEIHLSRLKIKVRF